MGIFSSKFFSYASVNVFEKYFHKVTRYHFFFFFFMFVAKFFAFWHMLNLIFLSPKMDFTCEGGEASCPCEKPNWDRSVFTETIQTKYGIYCEKAWMTSFSQSMLYVGTLIGAFLFGFMADKFGRLPMFCASNLTIGVAGIITTFMPNFASFIIVRVLEGTGVGGTIVTGYVLLVEYCGATYRDAASALYHLPLNVSVITLAGVSYLLRHCDQLQIVLSIPLFFCGALYFLLNESPKWLVTAGKIDKAEVVMKKVLKFNKLPTNTVRGELEAFVAQQQANRTHTKVSFWQIFRHKRLVINFFCMAFMYFVCGMGYYGVSQYIGRMSGDIHVNVAISGCLLIPGTLICTVLLKLVGRRPFLMTTNFLSGVFMIIVICIPARIGWLRVLFACLGNSTFFMSFIIVFLYGVELFPTCIRNSVLGFLSVLSRVGQIFAPTVNALPEFVSGAIFGILAIIAAILVILLPETKDTELPTSLEDSKSLTRKKKPRTTT